MVSNILTTAKYYQLSEKKDYIQSNLLRKNAMYDNFKKVYKHYSGGKFYGQWGLEHTYLNNVKTKIYDKSKTRFATAINKDENSPVKDKVCSITIHYINSFQMNKKTGEPDTLKTEFSNKGKELETLELFTNSNITFFKLDGKDSPFKNNLYFFSPQNIQSVTTDYFQYMITVKNSPACTMKN